MKRRSSCLYFFQFSWASDPISNIKIGIYPARSMKPMDYDALEFYCAPASRGVCNRRYDVPGTYYYTSGQVTGGNDPVAFSGKVIVLDVKQRTTPLLVLKKGKFVKRDLLTCLKFAEKVLTFIF